MRELSGDRLLTRKEQVHYLGTWLRRFGGLCVSVPTRSYCPKSIPDGVTSLFRKYIDAFLTDVMPTFIPKQEISVFDIGCGGGYVRSILGRLGYSGTYTGLDIVREKRFDTNGHTAFTPTFIQGPVETYVGQAHYDFIFSNTSLEHVEDDALAVAQAHKLRSTAGVEIHIVPSVWSFFLYLWHGYRHYTYGRIKAIFAGSSYVVYPLGGFLSFCAQFFLITIPERYLKMNLRNRSWYPALARVVMRLDRFLPLCPIGYAIVVHD